MEGSEKMKICPRCRSEYYPHVETCAGCGAVLLSAEEHAGRQEAKRRCLEQPLEDPVALREGEARWMEELHGVLIDEGIPCRLHSDPECRRGCCGGTCRLLVSRRDAERADGRIEEYFAEIHPEVRASRELLSRGKCPACQGDVEADAIECPDCGLILLITE